MPSTDGEMNRFDSQSAVFQTKSLPVNLDGTDLRILDLLIAGHKNREIAQKLRMPISTVQRRARRLFEKGAVHLRAEPDYQKLGFRRGLIHIYLRNGDEERIGGAVATMPGVTAVSIHVGNSDVVANFLYKESRELFKTLSAIKKLEGVDRIMWSEEILSIPLAKDNLIGSLLETTAE